jgi:hypothetical protein
MKLKRVRFEVSFLLPSGAKIADARSYVLDACSCYCHSLRPPGSYCADDPGDPMFSLDPASVHVKRIGPLHGKKHK